MVRAPVLSRLMRPPIAVSLPQGEVGEPMADAVGAGFRARCPLAMEVCAEVEPEPYRSPAGTTLRCHLHTSDLMLAGDTIRLLGDPSQMEGNGGGHPVFA